MLSANAVVKQMGLTYGDFFRIIPTALGSTNYQQNQTGIVYQDGSKTLTITLGPQTERKIALMALPTVTVTLTFEGYTRDQQVEALTMFDHKFRRGGG